MAGSGRALGKRGSTARDPGSREFGRLNVAHQDPAAQGSVRQAASDPGPAGLPGPGGDSDALRAAVTGLLPDLRGFARFLTRDPVAADDLVQDTLVRALGGLAQFRPDSNLKAWLFTIERNAFYEQSRRRRRESELIGEHGLLGQAGQSPEAGARGEVRDLQRLLFALPPLLREALVLVGAQELTYEEAAGICGVPTGTMKARVSRARSQLARAMGSGKAD